MFGGKPKQIWEYEDLMPCKMEYILCSPKHAIADLFTKFLNLLKNKAPLLSKSNMLSGDPAILTSIVFLLFGLSYIFPNCFRIDRFYFNSYTHSSRLDL